MEKTLYPNIVETLSAAQILVNDGFDVMVYTSDDPIVAKELENIGSRPAITACFIALAIKIGSLALAMAEFMSTPSQPNSPVMTPSLLKN
jgi:thiazole synthase ThiGH ThiG subunit